MPFQIASIETTQFFAPEFRRNGISDSIIVPKNKSPESHRDGISDSNVVPKIKYPRIPSGWYKYVWKKNEDLCKNHTRIVCYLKYHPDGILNAHLLLFAIWDAIPMGFMAEVDLQVSGGINILPIWSLADQYTLPSWRLADHTIPPNPKLPELSKPSKNFLLLF